MSLTQRAALAACLVAGVRAGYVMEKEEGPGLFYVHGRYKFYVSEKSPDSDAAVMEISKFQITPSNLAGTTSGNPPKLNLAMVPLRSFQQFVADNISMCTEDHIFRIDPRHSAVTKEISSTAGAVSAQLKLSEGGAHMFMIVNCQSNDAVTVGGSVRVKNSWGYLDGTDYYKLPVYACALGVSLISIFVYGVVIMQQEETIRDTQYYCLLLVFMSLVEAGLACGNLYMENEGMPTWHSIVEAVYLAKLMYGLTFMAQTAMGLGFTVHRLDWVTTTKCYVIVLVYVLAAMPKIRILSIRPHLALFDTRDIIQATAPVVIVTSVILCWLVWSLGSLMRELRKRDDSDALAACKRIAGLFGSLMVAASLTLVGQMGMSEKEVAKSTWKFALWNDAIASATFLAIIIAMMYFSMENFVGIALQMDQLPTNELDVEDAADSPNNKGGAHDDEEEAIFGEGPPSAQTIGAAVE